MSNKIENVLRIGSGIQERYVGTVSTDILQDITQVFTSEPDGKNNVYEATNIDGKEGYQRKANVRRQNKFAEYLEKNQDSFAVPAVFLNGRGKWKFTTYDKSQNKDFGYLEITDRANIIDGQHRCGGFINLFKKKGIKLDCEFVVYANVPIDDETRFFDTINTTQKGVPPSLSHKNVQNKWEIRVANRFATDEESPMKGMISLTGQMKEQHRIQLAAVSKNILRTFGSASLEETNEDQRFEIMCEIWSLIKQKYPEEWETEGKRREMKYKLLELTGFIAWSLAFNRNLGFYFDQEDSELKQSRLSKAIDRTVGMDWKKDGEFTGLTGEVGGRKMAAKIERLMQQE